MKRIYTNLIFFVFLALFSTAFAAARDSTFKSERTVMLGETAVTINVYEKKGAGITFVAPHFDEQVGTNIVKETIAKNGGRLVEIESRAADGKPARYLNFSYKGKDFRLDPNRIYTANGRRCAGFSGEIEVLVGRFAEELLKIFLAEGGSLREGERFLAAVHNNMDISVKKPDARNGDLTAYAFVRFDKSAHPSRGAFQKQAEGVYLSNLEEDEDNFIFLSTPAHIGYFAERGFNVVVQKASTKLQSADCAVDDGSLSVFAGQQSLAYINIEADARTGSLRQRQMIESVYELSKPLDKRNERSLNTVAEK